MDFYKMAMSIIKFYTQLKLEQYETKFSERNQPNHFFESEVLARNESKLKIRLMH